MYPAFFFSLGKIVFFIPGDTCYIKPFGKAYARFTIYINHIISSAFIIFLKYSNVNNVFTNKGFITYFYHFHYTSFGKCNDVVKVRNFRYQFIFF